MARPAGFEPATIRLEGGCSIRLSYGRLTVKIGRGREIRTPDILLPKQARYQTALYPVIFTKLLQNTKKCSLDNGDEYYSQADSSSIPLSKFKS